MQISLREAATYLNVPETTVRRWISTRGLPAHRANERLYCNAIELWEWALENGISASKSLLDRGRRSAEHVAPISALIRDGGIHRDLSGETKPVVLREVVGVLPLPPEVDREFLVTVLEAREALGSTGIGDGIAIPHVRNPILLHVDQPFVSLCLLRDPVPFDAVDGLPVHALFVLVSPNVPAHLRILARLTFLLRDAELRRRLRARATNEEILARIDELEGGAAAAAGVRR